MMKRSFLYLTFALALALSTLVGALPSWATTLEEEVELGRKLDVQILKEYPSSTDSEALKQIDEYGQKLAKNVRRPEIKYHFRILRDDELNAFSTPGGYVYFTDRLWNTLRKDERIGVLAHEIVHSDHRHALDAISKAQRRQLLLAVLLTAVKANETWGNVAGLAHQVYTLKYSRSDERQADEVGVELCEKAGYNPVGLLLAMRKINRFHSERGGEPPKIFSSHPPTKERLTYLTELLQRKGITVPPEDVQEVANPHKIGDVAAVSGEQVTFSSTKSLRNGDAVWLMGSGWDFHYENRTAVPIARAIVTSTGASYGARFWLMPGVKSGDVAKGTGVYSPPEPKAEAGVGRVEALSSLASDLGTLKLATELPRLSRLLARQIVWTADRTKLVYDDIGYVVLTDKSGANRFISASRPGYSYAPVAQGSVLAKLVDPDQKRWVGPVISIGRSGQTLEVATERAVAQLESDRVAGKVFDVLLPAWKSGESYENRTIATAVVKSLDKKIVFQISSFKPGYGMDGVLIGFDLYEQVKPK